MADNKERNSEDPCMYDKLTGRGIVHSIDNITIIEFDTIHDLITYDFMSKNPGRVCYGEFDDSEASFLGFSTTDVRESAMALKKFKQLRKSVTIPSVVLKRLPNQDYRSSPKWKSPRKSCTGQRIPPQPWMQHDVSRNIQNIKQDKDNQSSRNKIDSVAADPKINKIFLSIGVEFTSGDNSPPPPKLPVIPYLFKCGNQNPTGKCQDLILCANANKKFGLYSILTVGRGRILPNEVVKSVGRNDGSISRLDAYIAASAIGTRPTNILVPASEETIEKLVNKSQYRLLQDKAEKTRAIERKKWSDCSSINVCSSISNEEKCILSGDMVIAARDERVVMTQKRCDDVKNAPASGKRSAGIPDCSIVYKSETPYKKSRMDCLSSKALPDMYQEYCDKTDGNINTPNSTASVVSVSRDSESNIQESLGSAAVIWYPERESHFSQDNKTDIKADSRDDKENILRTLCRASVITTSTDDSAKNGCETCTTEPRQLKKLKYKSTAADGNTIIDLTNEEDSFDSVVEVADDSVETPIPKWAVICTSLPELGFVKIDRTANKLNLYDTAVVSEPFEFETIEEMKKFLNSRLADLSFPYRSRMSLDWIVVTAGFLRVKTVPPTNPIFWQHPNTSRRTLNYIKEEFKKSSAQPTREAHIVPAYWPRGLPAPLLEPSSFKYATFEACSTSHPKSMRTLPSPGRGRCTPTNAEIPAAQLAEMDAYTPRAAIELSRRGHVSFPSDGPIAGNQPVKALKRLAPRKGVLEPSTSVKLVSSSSSRQSVPVRGVVVNNFPRMANLKQKNGASNSALMSSRLVPSTSGFVRRQPQAVLIEENYASTAYTRTPIISTPSSTHFHSVTSTVAPSTSKSTESHRKPCTILTYDAKLKKPGLGTTSRTSQSSDAKPMPRRKSIFILPKTSKTDDSPAVVYFAP